MCRMARCRWRSDHASSTRSITARSRSSARCSRSAPTRTREDHIGFPPLMAALSCSRSQPGSPARPDVLDIMKLLLEFGADPNQRGINDYTPLHMAVGEQNCAAVRLLLEAGADPELRTRSTTMRRLDEMAVNAGLSRSRRCWGGREETALAWADLRCGDYVSGSCRLLARLWTSELTKVRRSRASGFASPVRESDPPAVDRFVLVGHPERRCGPRDECWRRLRRRPACRTPAMRR